MVRIYYTIFESISHEEEKVDECNGFKKFNRFTGKVAASPQYKFRRCLKTNG